MNKTNIMIQSNKSEIIKIQPYGKGDLLVENLKRVNESAESGTSKATHSWIKQGNSYFIGRKPNTDSIPSAQYEIRSSMEQGVWLEKINVLTDDIFVFPDPIIDEILIDMEKFWSLRAKYAEYGITYKRGVLVHGKPGVGKSVLTNVLAKEITSKHNGIVINVSQLHTFIPIAHQLRALEPDKPILAIIDELEEFIYNNSTKDFLNLLDGNIQIDNVCYIATTNYIDRIEPRIKSRPSRFDIVYEVQYPSPETREFFIKRKLKEEDLKNIDISTWVRDTKGMSFAHIKELIISVIVMGNDYDKTIFRLKNMMEIS